jgi:mRNA interferase MazF
VSAGQIVVVDWRDALPGSGEPNKARPAIVVGSAALSEANLPFEIVVPLTGEERLAIAGASLKIAPTKENGCTKACYALAWCVQTVPHARIVETSARVTPEQLHSIRAQIANCIGL